MDVKITTSEGTKSVTLKLNEFWELSFLDSLVYKALGAVKTAREGAHSSEEFARKALERDPDGDLPNTVQACGIAQDRADQLKELLETEKLLSQAYRDLTGKEAPAHTNFGKTPGAKPDLKAKAAAFIAANKAAHKAPIIDGQVPNNTSASGGKLA